MCLDGWCKVKGFKFAFGWIKKMENELLLPTLLRYLRVTMEERGLCWSNCQLGTHLLSRSMQTNTSWVKESNR